MVIASMLAGVLGVIVCVLVADTIAIDRQYGMSEMIGSLPLSPGAYLAGKLLSVWGPVLALLALTATLSGAIVQSALGSIDVGVIAGYWLAAGLPLGLFASGLGVLWAARQPTRQRAALIGFAVTPVCMAMAAILVGDFMLVAGVRSTVALSTLDLSAAPDYPNLLAPAHLIKLALMFAAIAGSALFVRRRMQRQEQP
jgi:ABC-type transport system involved in multi-copper enzyme maturation permease subunit